MVLKFPDHFLWGTSTAAAQVETATLHQWKGLQSKDGYIFERTTDHELRRSEDIQYIKEFGSMYRCSLDWSRLQSEAFADFNEEVVQEYQTFFADLKDEGMEIMFVIHHFLNPIWFEEAGSWLKEDNIPAFIDFAHQCIEHFGEYVANWNTFNEPNVYCMNGFMLGNFPPHKKSYFKATRAKRHMAMAHNIVYDMIKEKYPDHPIGISLNTATFKAMNPLGYLAAKFTDWWFIDHTAKLFEKVDYCGLSYYAYVPFNPFPITEVANPGKLAKMKIPHDKLWGYYPEGFGQIMRRIHKKYGLPIIITENGICTDDQKVRIESIKDYMKVCHEVIEEGIPLIGYMHWSTWDNFEWDLGPTYRFGLVHVDLDTMNREMTDAGRFYAQITKTNEVKI